MATAKQRKEARKKVSKKGVLKHKDIIKKALESDKPKKKKKKSNRST